MRTSTDTGTGDPDGAPATGGAGEANVERDNPEVVSRRRFLNILSLSLGGIAAALVGVPVIGFLFSPLLRPTPESWRPVGSVSSFKVGETVEVKFEDASPLPWAGVAAQTAAWLYRQTEDKFIAFSVHCTHLGCPVNWLPDARLFLCPCHGGVYYSDGKVAAGPPPRSLPTYDVRVNNGQVEIKTSPIPISG